jgi:hypothetical protein
VASDSACWDGSPFDAVAGDEASSVVGVVGESVGGASGAFGEHVEVLDFAVRGSCGSVDWLAGQVAIGRRPVDHHFEWCR